jgi:hypothetical protein
MELKINRSSIFGWVLTASLLSAVGSPQQQRGTPIPPGVKEADRLPGPADVAPLNQGVYSRPSAQEMRDQARELAELAQGIPGYVAQVTNGTLPKDMNEKLKRIEKLSKALRGEIGR